MVEDQLELKNQICYPIYSVSRLITSAYKPHLDKLNLTYPQYLVLMVLWEKDEVSVNYISERLLLQSNTLSPLLKRLEKAEIITRERSKEDERSVNIKLTQKGINLKEMAKPIPDNLAKTLLTENIQLKDVLQLKDMLNEWIQVLTTKELNK